MQKPTKAFADMVAETADKLQAILTEIYPDGDNHEKLRRSNAAQRGVVTRLRNQLSAEKFREVAR